MLVSVQLSWCSFRYLRVRQCKIIFVLLLRCFFVSAPHNFENCCLVIVIIVGSSNVLRHYRQLTRFKIKLKVTRIRFDVAYVIGAETKLKPLENVTMSTRLCGLVYLAFRMQPEEPS